jgi:hypothetical protein
MSTITIKGNLHKEELNKLVILIEQEAKQVTQERLDIVATDGTGVVAANIPVEA